jgi:hypothetical protein
LRITFSKELQFVWVKNDMIQWQLQCYRIPSRSRPESKLAIAVGFAENIVAAFAVLHEVNECGVRRRCYSFPLSATSTSQLEKRDPVLRELNRVGRVSANSTSILKVPGGCVLIIAIVLTRNLTRPPSCNFRRRMKRRCIGSLSANKAGLFPENLHRLIGNRASLLNTRNEIDEWLPSITQEPDSVIYFAGYRLTKGGWNYLAPRPGMLIITLWKLLAIPWLSKTFQENPECIGDYTFV